MHTLTTYISLWHSKTICGKECYRLFQHALKEPCSTQSNVALCSLYRCSWIAPPPPKKKNFDLSCTKCLLFHKPITKMHAIECMNAYFFQCVNKHGYTAVEKYETDIIETKLVSRLQSAMTAQQRRVISGGKLMCCCFAYTCSLGQKRPW